MQRPRRKSNSELQNYGRIRDVSKANKSVLKFRKKGNGESAEHFAERMNAKFGDKVAPGELFA